MIGLSSLRAQTPPLPALPEPPAVRSPIPSTIESRTPPPAERPVTPPSLPPVAATASADYVLSPSDTIEMSIFREPEMTTRGRVATDGTVQLPLIGDIKVAGMSVRAARQLIEKLYNADYLVDPQVRLDVVDYAQRQFTILGQVTKPGSYSFTGGRSLELLEAIAMAGGFTQYAGNVTVKRAVKDASVEAFKINAKKLATNRKESFQILPGDVITVGESWF
jgi:protein involved in polysaccharide export with SLBB domain